MWVSGSVWPLKMGMDKQGASVPAWDVPYRLCLPILWPEPLTFGMSFRYLVNPQPTALQATGVPPPHSPLPGLCPRLEGRKGRQQGDLSMPGDLGSATCSRNQMMLQVLIPPGNVSKNAFLQGACVSLPGRFILYFAFFIYLEVLGCFDVQE